MRVLPAIDGTCSEQSAQGREPICGTATAQVQHWLALEYRGRWERDVASTALPEAVQARLAALAEELPGLRVQLVRRTGCDTGPLSVWLSSGASLRRYAIDDLHDVAGLPLDDAGDIADELYLVCTHGKRDICCAQHGVGLWRSLSKVTSAAWQSSHQGGHRFAATMVWLPHGVQYGRLSEDDGPAIVAAHDQGLLYRLDRYRGQTSYARHVQAAEWWLRHETNDLRISGMRFINAVAEERQWHVEFDVESTRHRVTVALSSCDAVAPTPTSFYRLVRHEVPS